MEESESQKIHRLTRALRKKLACKQYARSWPIPFVIAPSLSTYLQWCLDNEKPPRHQVWAHEVNHLYGYSLSNITILGYPEGHIGEAMKLYVYAMTKSVD